MRGVETVENHAAEDLGEVMRRVHRTFVTGVTVVTTMSDEGPRGLAVNAFSSLSLEPPLVLVCVQKTSSTYGALFERDAIGINVVAATQSDVVAVFATKGADKFAQVAWRAGATGVPILEGATAHMEATIRERLQSQTHTLFIARVTHASATERPPIVYSAGKLYDSSALVPLS